MSPPALELEVCRKCLYCRKADLLFTIKKIKVLKKKASEQFQYHSNKRDVTTLRWY